MKEQLISFETAKLAKEKGFKVPCISYYDNGREVIDFKITNDHNNLHFTFSAPTQSLLQKWLREEQDIFVLVDYDGEEFDVKTASVEKHKVLDGFKSYEEALEEGLKEALKLIK